jgi:lysophospholipase L1-like esterase
MKKDFFCLVVGMLMLSFAQQGERKTKIFMAGDSTMSIKEPKAYPETGWGMPFAVFFDSTVEVVNRAKNGRSTKTFISEGIWQSIYNEMQAGDYVLIQFGHNDESKEKKERYTTPDSFKINLRRFIADSRFKKAIPVLFTPVSRRKFDSTGTALETHALYSALAREVALSEKVLFIDLDSKSRELYQRTGKENSALLFLQLKPGDHPNYPQGKNDNTHFSELGARWIAQLVLSEMRSLKIDLLKHVKNENKVKL